MIDYNKLNINVLKNDDELIYDDGCNGCRIDELIYDDCYYCDDCYSGYMWSRDSWIRCMYEDYWMGLK